MIRRPVAACLVGLLLALVAPGCSDSLPVQPTPERIEDYFDAIIDEPVPFTKYIDECQFDIPIAIFVDQVYYDYWSVRTAIPKSLITRGTDGSVDNGEIEEVFLSCTSDVVVIRVLVTNSSYKYNDFFGEILLSPEEAQQIRTDLANFQPS